LYLNELWHHANTLYIRPSWVFHQIFWSNHPLESKQKDLNSSPEKTQYLDVLSRLFHGVLDKINTSRCALRNRMCKPVPTLRLKWHGSLPRQNNHKLWWQFFPILDELPAGIHWLQQRKTLRSPIFYRRADPSYFKKHTFQIFHIIFAFKEEKKNSFKENNKIYNSSRNDKIQIWSYTDTIWTFLKYKQIIVTSYHLFSLNTSKREYEHDLKGYNI